ncbi:YdcF family protein, partial [Neisseria sp. P0014.S006]|uniref:YdcF family protein n=1 Tax=Neisseria sp. P0014.S006 TaxID=3436752 RepID=UPI003F7F6CA8
NIIFENTSRNTYDYVRNIVPIMHANGIGSIIVFSDPYHLARAEEMAADFGLSDAQFSATPTTRYEERSKKALFLMQESDS